MDNMILISSETAQKTATYIKEAQSILEEADGMKRKIAEFDSMAEKAAETLVNAGACSEHLKAAKVDEFRANPAAMLEQLEKSAALAAPVEPVGGAAKEASHVSEELSADDKFAQQMLG
jgi:hypothetical protein